jgi:hypothetical protein
VLTGEVPLEGWTAEWTTPPDANIYESDPGAIAYLQVRDTPMTATEVADSLAAICGAVVATTTTTSPLVDVDHVHREASPTAEHHQHDDAPRGVTWRTFPSRRSPASCAPSRPSRAR